jgi:hypothetical protein
MVKGEGLKLGRKEVGDGGSNLEIINERIGEADDGFAVQMFLLLRNGIDVRHICGGMKLGSKRLFPFEFISKEKIRDVHAVEALPAMALMAGRHVMIESAWAAAVEEEEEEEEEEESFFQNIFSVKKTF